MPDFVDQSQQPYCSW